MSDNSKPDTLAAIEAGMANAEPKPIDSGGTLFSVTVPFEGTHKIIDLEQYGVAPRRLSATYRPATVAALSALIERHSGVDASTLWVHPENGTIIAIFNDHEASPGWRDHRAVLALKQTDEWKHWIGKDGHPMSQREFAEHIEDGMPELVAPPAAEMLELAQTFHAKTDVTFRSAVRLQDGTVQAQYDEVTDAKAGQTGQIKIPQEFTLGLIPFLGESRYGMTARLRYRVNAGKLSLGYHLDRPTELVRVCLGEIADKLAASHPDVPVFIGEPS